MTQEQIIIGPESLAIYYNLNKQFTNVKKLIITRNIILESFENGKVNELFKMLSKATPDNYIDILNASSVENVFEDEIKSEFYQVIQDNLNKLYDNIKDIQLKDYNFMNAMSNRQFTISLKCESFTISENFREKGTILSAIKSVLKKYLKFEGNSLRIGRLENFQIEIYESEEIYKHIYLKKDSNRLILSSSFGFPRSTPINYNIGPELYYSEDEKFNFFKNVQSTAIIRDHTKIVENEINKQEKVLTNDDLIKINEQTKNINDALIELYINKKGNLRILNVFLNENSIGSGNEKGFIINKSNNNYDRVSTVTLRDSLGEEFTNPRFLLIRNQEEIRELFDNLNILNLIDGLILTSNFYTPYFDLLGIKKNIDILFYNSPVSKSLDLKIDFNNLDIEGSEQRQSIDNPFATIIDEGNKEKDEFLERLKSIDLNSPPPSQNNSNDITSLAQDLISSPNSSKNSSYNSSSSSSSGLYGGSSSSSGEKKSALGMLADAALNQSQKTQTPPQPTPQQQTPMQSEQIKSVPEFVEKNISAKDLNPISNETINSIREKATEVFPENNFSQNTSLNILTTPTIKSGHYFADQNTISQVTGGEIFYIVIDKENMKNPSVNYILPIALSDSTENCYLLVNNPNEFFMLKDESKNYFMNLTQIDSSIKEQFLKSALDKLGKCSLIVFKEDIELVVQNKDKLENVFIKNLTSEEEYQEIKKKFSSDNSQNNNQGSMNTFGDLY